MMAEYANDALQTMQNFVYFDANDRQINFPARQAGTAELACFGQQKANFSELI